jgi:hypothetical protein
MWEWYVIVGQPVRFERLVNSRLSSDDDSQEFVIFDSFGVGPDLFRRAQWLRLVEVAGEADSLARLNPFWIDDVS